VRPEAAPSPRPLKLADAIQEHAATRPARPSAALGDLKRIRGIGVLIEKKLNSMGVTTYEQVANWTAEDIDRASQALDFKGRIERENWVEQARILASGGAPSSRAGWTRARSRPAATGPSATFYA